MTSAGRVAGFACALVTFVSCTPGVPPVGNYATVLGQVVDSTTGAGVANATVVVNVILSATTDASGSFRIAGIPTGSWEYSVQVPAKYIAPPPVDNPTPLAPGEARTISIALSPR